MDASLVTAGLRALTTAGALDDDELAAATGLDPDDDGFDHLWDELAGMPRVTVLLDDRLLDVVWLLGQVVLTHRVTREELDSGVLVAEPDLLPLLEITGDGVPLASGGRAAHEIHGSAPSTLRGPAGWLPAVAPGDLLGFSLAGGVLVVRSAEPSLSPDHLTSALASAIELLGDEAQEVRDVIAEVAVADPAVLDQTWPPLGELLARAGWNERDAETSAAVLREYLLRRAYDLDVQGYLDAQRLFGLAEDARWGAAAVQEAAELLSTPAVADAAAGERSDRPGLVQLARAVLVRDDVPSAARAGAELVVADAAEQAGDAIAAEASLRRAVDALPTSAPALLRLADYAELRGDARAAASLLRRAGASQDDVDDVEHWADAGAPGVGRNDPCPCGSGRKAKRCCGGRQGGPIERRARWLVDKVITWLQHPHRFVLLADATEAWSGHRDISATDEAVRDALFVDIVVFAGGLLERFLAERGALLPDDERALAESWRSSSRLAVHRVDRASAGGVTLVALADGASAKIVRSDAEQLRAGDHVLCRVVPAGSENTLFLPGRILDAPRANALAPQVAAAQDDAAALARLLGPRPRLLTTEGEPTVLCDVRVRVPNGDDVRDHLLAGGWEPEDDDPHVLREWRVDRNGGRWLRAVARFTGEAVHVEASSQARADRALAAVLAAAPGAQVLLDARVPAEVAMDDLHRFGVPRPPSEPSADARAALASFIRAQEQAWLDEDIPALGGRTPRQAALDPDRRRDLLALLDSFPVGLEGTFDPRRLRADLGL